MASVLDPILTFQFPPWLSRAACGDLPEAEADALFFPDRGQTARRARVICGGCPVVKECLEYAVEHDCEGVWGGTTAAERRALKRKREVA